MNNKKTILITAPYFPPYGGGLERYALEVSKMLSDDFNIVVVTSGERFGDDTLEHQGNVKIYRLSYNIKICNTPFSFKWFRKIRRIVKNEKPNLINIHMPVPGIGDIASMVSVGIPKVVTYHSGTISKGFSFWSIFTYIYESFLLKYILMSAKSIICSSDYVRFGILKKYLHKSITITPGVDTEKFYPDESKKTENASILFVAGLGKSEKYKGLTNLINSIKDIIYTKKDLILNVVGDGDLREEYENYVRSLGLENNIKFWGKLDGEKLVEKYQKNHILVSASTNESFSMVILEAMSCALPIIAIDVGSTSQMIEDGKNGFLLKCSNNETIKDKIIELIESKEKSKKFGEISREKVKAYFTWKSKIENYRTIIDKIIK